MARGRRDGCACPAHFPNAGLAFLAGTTRRRVPGRACAADAFINSGLERWLHARGIAQVLIVGVSTNNSVEATARTAGNLGFETQVVADATFAFDKIDYAGKRRTAEEFHAMALANLDGEYATVVDTQRMLDAFRR
jgi:nicotinamidase-related amidase